MIYLLALVGAFFAGCINTLAGNGSAITLTLLTDVLGLPPVVANATNRVGVAAQCGVSTRQFYRSGLLDLANSRHVVVFTVIGALAGIYVAGIIDNASFRAIFRYLLLAMLVVILVRPSRWLRRAAAEDVTPKLPAWLSTPLFLALGFYGGFIQMGMGVFFLAATVLLARYDIIRANALKSAVVGIYTLIAVIYYAAIGLIHWPLGLLLAVGQMGGAYLTARFATQNDQAALWAYRLLVVVIIGAIVKVFWPEISGWWG